MILLKALDIDCHVSKKSKHLQNNRKTESVILAMHSGISSADGNTGARGRGGGGTAIYGLYRYVPL